MQPRIPLPRGWSAHTKSAIVQILALSHYASSKPAISLTIRRRSWGSRIVGPVQPLTFEFFIKQLRCNWNLTVHNGACLFILLFFFQFSFFLWTKLSLFLLFPFAFIFTSLITHICFSVVENECSSQLRQTGLTFSALGPFGPRPSVYDTRCPSWSSS